MTAIAISAWLGWHHDTRPGCFARSCLTRGCLTRGCYLARAADVATKALEDLEGGETPIVKVQVALFPRTAAAVVSAEGRVRVRNVMVPAKTLKALGDDNEGHFRATWTGDNWVIHERVADQDW